MNDYSGVLTVICFALGMIIFELFVIAHRIKK